MSNIKFNLVLYPDTFLWVKEGYGLMYNSKEHSAFLFQLTTLIQNYCIQLQDSSNLYTIPISKEEWACDELREWIEKVSSHKVGFIIEYVDNEPTPISFPPLLNLQSDIDRIEAAESRDIGEYAAQNWNEFSIYLGGESKFPDLYKQVPYPVNANKALDFKDLQTFLSSADNSYLNTINVVGNLFSYPYKDELMDLLYGIPVKKNFYLTASHASLFIKEIVQMELSNYKLYIYYEGEEAASIHQELIDKKIDFCWIYLVSSEEQSEELERLEASYGNEYIEVRPIYTVENLPFFENNIYSTEEDILQSHYDKQDIFAHQVMNTNFWGKLSVLPDGKVYSNLNHLPIGTLKDRVYDLIVDEMKSKRSWRWIRDDMLPCKNCLYRYLCPSPSNYEIVTGKTNLCYVKPN